MLTDVRSQLKSKTAKLEAVSAELADVKEQLRIRVTSDYITCILHCSVARPVWAPGL